jgi:toxin-antitoxin system PIN domain toxin
MKPCLADVNVLLPLLVRHHEHHELVLRWFDGLAAGEAVLCRFVQLALVRLLGNRTVMGEYAISASAAWDLIAELLEDERMEFAPEPALIDVVFPKLLRYAAPTSKLVGDAYLAAFSIAGQMRLATVDKGFGQFREVDLRLLAP